MKIGNLVKSIAIVTATLFASLANAQDVELATNLGFEDPVGMQGEDTPDQWNPFEGAGAGAGTNTIAPLDGATHAAMTIDATGDSFAGFQYRINEITVGESYTFSFSARSEGVNLGGVDGEFRFEFFDAAGEFVGGQFDFNEPVNPGDTYEMFSQTRLAPPGAVSLRAVVAVQSFGMGADGSDSDTGTLFVDGASIQGPPIGTPPDDSEPPMPGPVMELVSNPSFEDPIGEPQEETPGQWNPFDNGGNTSGTTAMTNPLTGTTHAVASILGDEDSFAGFFQEVGNIVPGEDYTFSFSARSEGANLEGIDAEFRIEFVDVNGAFLGDQFANNEAIAPNDSYATFMQTRTAPANAAALRAVIAVQSFGGGADGSNSNSGALFIDDTSIMGSLAVSDVMKADVNLDGAVDFFDIQPFIDVLSAGGTPDEETAADVDCNGMVDFFDIQPFIDALAGP